MRSFRICNLFSIPYISVFFLKWLIYSYKLSYFRTPSFYKQKRHSHHKTESDEDENPRFSMPWQFATLIKEWSQYIVPLHFIFFGSDLIYHARCFQDRINRSFSLAYTKTKRSLELKINHWQWYGIKRIQWWKAIIIFWQ